jgi:hypothetical protein
MSKTSKLHKLSRRRPTHADHPDYMKQVTGEHNDRGACILISSNVENALQSAIEQSLGEMTEDLFVALFESNGGPASSFSNQINLAFALKIIGPRTYANVNILRHVRNAFAHAKVPIRFDTPEVKDICDDLALPERAYGGPFSDSLNWQGLTTRDRFVQICNITSQTLFAHSLGAREPIDNRHVKTLIGDSYVGYLQRKSLP